MDDFYRLLLTSAAAFIIGSLLSLLAARISRVIFGRIAARTKTKTDDFIFQVIANAIKPLGLLISASIAWKILPIENEISNAVLGIIKLICLILLVRLINKIVFRLIERWSLKINDSSVSTMLRSLSPMFRALVWCIGFIFYLQNMGVQMAAIWALLSAGGIGAGLALKEPVQEFFEYITILLDKPFENGQFINVDGIWASVERVGVRSTRLRSINGEIIVMSNSALTNGKIANYGEMEYRRLVHKLGVVYETPHSTMQHIPSIIQTIVDSTEDVIFDRCHFIEFGQFSLDFELVYYIPTNNYLRAMEAQQKVNLEIMKIFEEKSIDFAYPTQTIHLTSNGQD
ncbi:mechanosensitive ion channel family protein [Prochlorococcus sp. MIT 1307]|uniref:mechanosensitive ion channel family protein n=1 Tax=Prochlorococcus sp. MIT 1307 TaxID=3096219 RepID=UPI002A74BDD9|nr:mechanosensitive ion channel family protein [Prochlorococcus sp. MIT 1307]